MLLLLLLLLLLLCYICVYLHICNVVLPRFELLLLLSNVYQVLTLCIVFFGIFISLCQTTVSIAASDIIVAVFHRCLSPSSYTLGNMSTATTPTVATRFLRAKLFFHRFSRDFWSFSAGRFSSSTSSSIDRSMPSWGRRRSLAWSVGVVEERGCRN